MRLPLLICLCFAVVALSADSVRAAAALKPPTVMAWVASPFGFWGGPYNKTKLDAFINEVHQVKDFVDIISIVSYAVHDPTKLGENDTGLDLLPNLDVVIEALQNDGWRVEPLVGDYYGQNYIEWYRTYLSSEKFFNAVVNEVKTRKFDGINFDFEPQDCAKAATPCSLADAARFAGFLTRLKSAVGPHVRVSVDTGQSILGTTAELSNSTADSLVTMNTYGSLSDFKVALKRDFARDGANRFGLGIMPSYTSDPKDVDERFDLAISTGVREIDIWAGVKYPSVWVDGIKRWKSAMSGLH